MIDRTSIKADVGMLGMFVGLAAMVAALVVGLKPLYIVGSRVTDTTFEVTALCVVVSVMVFAPVLSSVIKPSQGMLAAGLASGLGVALVGLAVWIYGIHMDGFPSWALGILLAVVVLGTGLLVGKNLQERMLGLDAVSSSDSEPE